MKSTIRVGAARIGRVRPAIVATLVSAVFVSAVFAGVVLVLPNHAAAQMTTKPVVMMGKGSGKCIRVAEGSTTAGATILQWTCDESVGSRWTLQPAASGSAPHVQVVASHSGKCLSVSEGSTADEAPLVQSDCTGADSQLWTVESYNETYGHHHRLVAKHSGKCANVRWALTGSGASLVQYPCSGADNELWLFSDGYIGPTQNARLVNASSNLCADVQFESEADGASILQWHCKRSGFVNQQWSLQRVSDGYQLAVRSSGKCLAPNGGSTASGATMVQTFCGPALGQVWRLAAAGPDRFTLVNKGSGQCLDLGGDQASPDASLVQNPCSGAATQSWRLSNVWEVGTWSSRIGLPIVPVAAAAFKNNRLLFWATYQALTFEEGTRRPVSQAVVYDIASETGTALETNTNHDFFCPGTAMLADGRLLVNGGMTAWNTTIYDPVPGDLGAWSNGGAMRVPRGYNSNVVTSGGKVFTIGGSWNGNSGQDKQGELWNPSRNSWTALNGLPTKPILGDDPAGLYRSDNHAWMFGVGGGKVFHAGPSAQMNWLDTNGSGNHVPAGYRSNAGYAINGNAVMYDINRILTLGGAPAYDYAPASPRAYTIDINSGVKVKQTGSMAYPRTFTNSVVLPTGQVIVFGGQAFSRLFTDVLAALAPEMWDPTTGTFSVMAPASIPRTYHSIALLIPDGRVVVGGGGLCGNTCDNNHTDFEYYAPGYLFSPDGREAVRPVITGAPTTIGYNSEMEVTTDTDVSAFVLVRLGSVTHSVNNDQRRVPLSIVSQSGTSYVVKTPKSSGIATPGDYMLFVLDPAGVPSKAAIVRVG